jgi:hypothetical protein
MNEQPMKQKEADSARMKEAQMKGEGMKSMREISAQVARHHLEPTPMAGLPEPDSFPAPVMHALGLGALGGLALGMLWSLLLLNHVVDINGWDNLYSMTPFTFSVFWAVMGAALSGLVVGVIGILRS